VTGLAYDVYADRDKSRVRPGATVKQKNTTPPSAIRLTRAVLGSVCHQASEARTTRSVGTSDVVHEIHDIAVRCDRRERPDVKIREGGVDELVSRRSKIDGTTFGWIAARVGV